MKNILIIHDGAINDPLDIFVATDKEFEKIFANEITRVSLRDLQERLNHFEINEILYHLSKRRISKKNVDGINGVLYKTYTEKVDNPYSELDITTNYSGYKYVLFYEYEPEIFAVTHEEFSVIFKLDTDVAFTHELELLDMLDGEELKHYSQAEIIESQKLRDAMDNMLSRHVALNNFTGGISGTLFHRNESKAIYYPTHKDEEAINPDGTRLRAFGACVGQKEAIITYGKDRESLEKHEICKNDIYVDPFSPDLLLKYL